MTFLPAAIWNQIAQTEELQTPAAKVAFRLNPDQLVKQDDLWMKAEEQVGTPPKVARCLPTCLPLLKEAEAISQFVDQHPNLKGALPEMLDPEEATELMTADYRLTSDQQATLIRILSSPEAMDRWKAAADQAAA